MQIPNPRMSRRTFLKGSAALSASGLVTVSLGASANAAPEELSPEHISDSAPYATQTFQPQTVTLYGITTGKAHLNALDITDVQPLEIDWSRFKAWSGGKTPAFAGRYFLGQPYLWAHGEGAEANGQADITRIFPMQRADVQRQEATDDDGERYGSEDSRALCDYIHTCLNMGDLSLSGKFVYVFLEVADGTRLSTSYWSSWCSNVYNYLYFSSQFDGSKLQLARQPFLPCICCSFTKKVDASGKVKYAPAKDITDVLDSAYERGLGKQTRCFSFWARVLDVVTDPTVEPVLDWSMFDIYQQPQGNSQQPVFASLWRYIDGATLTSPIPGITEEVQRTLNKLTFDAAHEPTDEGIVSRLTLKVEDWSNFSYPVQFGIDRGSDATPTIRCTARTFLQISEMPATRQRVGVRPPRPLRGKPTFVGRYYSAKPGASPNPKDLHPSEAHAISRTGVDIFAIWQARVTYRQIPAHLLQVDIGFDEARDAFAFAANHIGQPAHTPIYFSIDALVSIHNGTTVVQDAAGVHTVPVPTIEQIVRYLTDVNRGYQQYLKDQEAVGLDPIPYYVGVYTSSNVLNACYIHGLATYFWQAWPPNWGDIPVDFRNPLADPNNQPNLLVWRHTNIWQVLVSNLRPGYWGDNVDLENCAGVESVDLNVAWGDVGGWKLY